MRNEYKILFGETLEDENRLRGLGSLLFCGAKWLYEQGNKLLFSITNMDFIE
jgi:hypothetical protein